MKSIFVVYAFLLSYVHGYGQSCPRDTVRHAVYGPGCKYLCHCKVNTEQCDDKTGSCMSGCADKWMGPGCQYRDILWRKETRILNGNNAYETVDGNADTCSSTVTRDGHLWWRAWFEQHEIIRGMTIITKEANIGSFSGFKVYVEENTKQKNNNGFQRQEICYEHDGVSYLTTTITVICVRPLRGNQIRIQLDSTQTQLVLCDVRVFGGRNLAYSKQTSQSSTYRDRISSNAVDGSTNTADLNKCAFTNYNYHYSNHYWKVDLGKVVKVQALELISADQHRFRSDDIIQGGEDFILYPTQLYSNRNKTLFFTTDSDFRYLQIKRRQFLVICEVLVFGDCLENECGLDCNIPCHCNVFTFDNKISGECHEGCAVGWTGEGHKCDKACAPGRYGLECLEQCKGHCGNNIACDNVRGHCPHGCAAGWMGELCDEECSDGTYGLDCSNSCSDNCLDRGPCDKKSGRCRTGCKPGWNGDTCHTECEEGFYGSSCTGRCSIHCWADSYCNKTNGHCTQCKHGWTGIKCEEECPDGKYGNMCYYNCSGNCLHGRFCNKTNGDCDDGCSPGWRENMCNFECYSWYYGNGCGERCSYHCLNNDICDHVDGNCPRGCAAGWIGLKCDAGCNDGTHGINCSEQCSGHCMYNDICDKVDGRCPGKCAAGWKGGRCDSAAIMDRIKRRKLSEEETVKNHSEDQEKRLLILDMNEKEVEMLATHLGHDVRTHKENYRLAHSTRELTAVAQLLLTVERGDVNRWKGKKLCDIEIEDLEVLEDEKKDLDQNHKRGYAEDTHTALWDPPNEATQGLDLGGDSGSDGGDVQATVAQLCGQSTSVITEGASHLPGASTTQRVSTDKKGLPNMNQTEDEDVRLTPALAVTGEKLSGKSKNRPWSRAASDFLRNTFKPYLTGKDSSVHNSDMKNAQKICGELNTRSLPQIRAKLNNMKLGKSQ